MTGRLERVTNTFDFYSPNTPGTYVEAGTPLIGHSRTSCSDLDYARCTRINLRLLTLLEPQSRFGDKPFKSQLLCPQNGTAVLTGLIGAGARVSTTNNTRRVPRNMPLSCCASTPCSNRGVWATSCGRLTAGARTSTTNITRLVGRDMSVCHSTDTPFPHPSTPASGLVTDAGNAEVFQTFFPFQVRKAFTYVRLKAFAPTNTKNGSASPSTIPPMHLVRTSVPL